MKTVLQLNIQTLLNNYTSVKILYSLIPYDSTWPSFTDVPTFLLIKVPTTIYCPNFSVLFQVAM